ncbi:MAG: DNA polymerase III subunit alpha [Thermodesulfovibrio sp. RBG_19FT_COMBO_42_12]|nr:MAG: DNA polymerase III subunit alpha [Thermodesulfovibrio sp. RBG_19FT_COMBO_42_12]
MHQHSDYVSLHLHTEYSLLDGAIRIKELVKQATAFRMPAVAITDHGNLFGAVEFYRHATKAGIKPIIGCEVYVAPGNRFEKRHASDIDEASFHFVLLAKDNNGYRNLVSLVTKAYTEGFYYKPRIDIDLLKQYSEGLIGLTSCLKGEVPYYLQRGMTDKAREKALEYKHILGPDNFYIEVQDNNLSEQEEVNRRLIELARELHIGIVATNDCHYMKKEDSRAHDILLCIQTGKTIKDENRLRFNSDGFYFKSPEEMKNAFKEIPEAILNTRSIAERCNVKFTLGANLLPVYELENGQKPYALLEKLAFEGMHHKLGPNPDTLYEERLRREIDIIQKMRYSSYFLIVWDFISYAKKKGIPVGPGRGSAAGSLVSYCLDITDIDPVKYNLLFERFLNPERISMPDIDVDFCKDRRSEVISYVAEKYGKDHVAQIITFGTMAAKAAIRDVGRALDFPYSEVDKIAKLVPNTLNITIEDTLKSESQLKVLYDSNPRIKELINTAMRLEGLCRHASTHAAGVVISPAPLTDYSPLYRNPSDGSIMTQFDMSSIEKIGLLKFDFLGLKTLTVIDKALKYIRDNGNDFSLKDISFEDKKTYELLSSGHTTGIFQLESAGMRDLLIKISPNRFEDIIAIVALHRPGPMGSGMIDDFIKRKKGMIPVKYDLLQLKEILDETYGVILYQEQVMRIANKLANFTMGQADILRKAMGKKRPEEMEKLKEVFIHDARANGISEKKATRLFDLMAFFAEYGFNKSHSAAYAYIAYQTAYLKAHYPVEFMAATMSADMDNTDKIVKSINECREMGIMILPPDINQSGQEFKVIGNSIRFGLEAVKGVGSSAIESIIESKNTDGHFTSVSNFIERVDQRKVNKKVIDSLIKAGAFDSLNTTRVKAMELMNSILNGSSRIHAARVFGQQSIFGNITDQALEDTVEWKEEELLKYEKEALGFYITGHPLIKYSGYLEKIGTKKASELEEIPDGQEIKIGGILRSIKKIQTRSKAEIMAYFTLEDPEGNIEVIVFPDLYRASQTLLQKDNLLLVKGTVDKTEKGTKIVSTEISRLDALETKMRHKVEISLRHPLLNGFNLQMLKSIITSDSKGEYPLYLRIFRKDTETLIATGIKISPDSEIINRIEEIAGKGAVTFQ